MYTHADGFRADARRLRLLDDDVLVNGPRIEMSIERPRAIVCHRPEDEHSLIGSLDS